MAILKIYEQQNLAENSKFREIEIKKIINDVQINSIAEVEIECNITAYKTSFNHFLYQFNNLVDIAERKKFSFNKTENPKIWLISRVK